METKVKINIQFTGLILVCFLLSCGVKGDPEELKIETEKFNNSIN